MYINEKIKNMAKENEIGRKNPPVIILLENKKSLLEAIAILNYRLSLEK